MSFPTALDIARGTARGWSVIHKFGQTMQRQQVFALFPLAAHIQCRKFRAQRNCA
jgi:hypothetical protein